MTALSAANAGRADVFSTSREELHWCLWALASTPRCFVGGQNKQFDFVTFRFVLYFLHQGQSAVCTAADDELVASPGDSLFYRERCVELLLKFLGRFLLTFANFAAINDDIVLAHGPVDLDGAEREAVEMHTQTPWTLASGALFRRDGVEGRPALLDILATTMRTQDFPLFAVHEGQDPGKEFLAIVA
jgi:hypothetical protein